jgi:hypothetical protein
MKLLATILLAAFATLVTTDGFVCAECCKSAVATASCDCNVGGVCVLCATAYVPVAPQSVPVVSSAAFFAPVRSIDAPIAVDLATVYHPPRSI